MNKKKPKYSFGYKYVQMWNDNLTYMLNVLINL